MSLISRLFSLAFWAQLFQSFLATCQRFPLSILSLIVINLVFITDIHNLDILTDQQQRNSFFIAIGGALWFVATKLFSERLQWPKNKYYLLALPAFVLYSWFITQKNIIILESVVLILAAGLAITFAAYITRRSDNSSVWYFNYQLIAAICFALLSAVILCAGLSFILKSLEYLFEFDLTSKPYQTLWTVGMAFLAPVYFLANLPKQFDYPRSDCEFPKGVHFILNYILVPLSLIYVVILYAYFTKILIQGALPHGHLGSMISAFGVIGIIAHLAIYPLHDRGNSLLSWFYKYFYLMLIVPLGLLTVTIGARILQYGFTEQRYLVALCAVWFAILIILNLLKRKPFQLKYVTISLAMLSVLSSFGPWGIHQLPVNDQFSRLEATLIEHNLLTNGILNVTEQPSDDIQKSISSMVSYLVHHNATEKLRPWFADKEAFDNPENCDDSTECQHSAQKLVELMGFNYIHSWQESHSEHTEIHRQNFGVHNNVLAITGYDILIPIIWYGQHSSSSSDELSSNHDYQITIDDHAQLIVSIADSSIIQFDLAHYIAQFDQTGTIVIEPEQADKLILNKTTSEMDARLYIDTLQIWHNNGEIASTSLNGYLLLKHLN